MEEWIEFLRLLKKLLKNKAITVGELIELLEEFLPDE